MQIFYAVSSISHSGLRAGQISGSCPSISLRTEVLNTTVLPSWFCLEHDCYCFLRAAVDTAITYSTVALRFNYPFLDYEILHWAQTDAEHACGALAMNPNAVLRSVFHGLGAWGDQTAVPLPKSPLHTPDDLRKARESALFNYAILNIAANPLHFRLSFFYVPINRSCALSSKYKQIIDIIGHEKMFGINHFNADIHEHVGKYPCTVARKEHLGYKDNDSFAMQRAHMPTCKLTQNARYPRPIDRIAKSNRIMRCYFLLKICISLNGQAFCPHNPAEQFSYVFCVSGCREV